MVSGCAVAFLGSGTGTGSGGGDGGSLSTLT
jgi:hypothetical protein